MKGDELELLRGRANVFRALGYENADVEQLKALLQPKSFAGSIGKV